MKILYWLERFLPYIGGVETFSRQLIPAMQKRGHFFAIITSGHIQNSGQPEQTSYGSIWHFPFADVLESHDLRRIVAIDHQIAEIIHTFQPDLIHLNTILPSTFFYLRNRATGQIPTLLTLHMPVSLSRKNGIIEQVLNRANYVAAVSQAVLQEARETFPGITARTSVNYNALLDAPLSPAPLRWSPPVLLCVGRLAHQKGFDIALESFPQILNSYPTAILRIVGSGEYRRRFANRPHDVHHAHHRHDDTESRKTVSHLGHHVPRHFHFVMMRLDFDVHEILNFHGIEIAADHHAQIVGNEFHDMVVV